MLETAEVEMNTLKGGEDKDLRSRSDTELSIEDENARLTISPRSGSTEPELVPMWTLWRGKNKFCFGGRIITGPERGPFMGTVGMVGTPMVLFFAYVAYPLTTLSSTAWWAPVIGMLGFSLIFYCLLSAHCTDPGILPREPKRAKYVPRIISRVLDDGTTMRMRYCDTCNIYRPPRCHHCSDCGNCVEVFDHHCPWIGNCVARRNYRFFIGFLINVSCTLVFVFVASLHCLILVVEEQGSLASALARAPVTLVLMVYCFLIFLPVSCLTGYHATIISSGETTKEEVKRLFKDDDNPYDKGCLTNWWITLCVKAQASKLNALTALVATTYLDDDIPEDEEAADAGDSISSSLTMCETPSKEDSELPAGHATPSHLAPSEDEMTETAFLSSAERDEEESPAHLVEVVTMTPARLAGAEVPDFDDDESRISVDEPKSIV